MSLVASGQPGREDRLLGRAGTVFYGATVTDLVVESVASSSSVTVSLTVKAQSSPMQVAANEATGGYQRIANPR